MKHILSGALLLALFTLSAALGGCAASQKPSASVAGTVVYRERMALPPDAEVTVSLYETTAEGRRLVFGDRQPVAGRNIPLPFRIAVPADVAACELEAAIVVGGTTLFATPAPVPARPGDEGVTLLTQRVMERSGGAADVPADVPADGLAEGLAGVRWKLVELNGKPAEVYADQPEPHLLFDPAEGRLSGSDGCNRLIGGYTLTGGRIAFGQLGSTMMLCPKGDAQARALAQALAAATSVSRSGDRLSLYGGKARLAVFEARAL